MQFDLITKDPNCDARYGRVVTQHGSFETPVYMPVGTQGAVKCLTGAQLKVERDCTDPDVIADGYCQGFDQGVDQGTDQGVDQGLHQNDPTFATQEDQALDGTSTGDSSGELGNSTTGAGSTNTNSASHDRTLDATTRNTATIGNDIDMGVSTGGNDLTRNTRVGDLTTGDIEGTVSLINVANSVFAPGSSAGIGDLGLNDEGDLVLLESGERVYFPANEQTGADSTNTNTVSGTDVIRILTENNADVDNDIDIAADTGSNTLTDNSILGDILTGSIDLAVNLINLLNLTMPDTLFELDIWSIFSPILLKTMIF